MKTKEEKKYCRRKRTVKQEVPSCASVSSCHAVASSSKMPSSAHVETVPNGQVKSSQFTNLIAGCGVEPKIAVFDFFCGCGGTNAGFRAGAGLERVGRPPPAEPRTDGQTRAGADRGVRIACRPNGIPRCTWRHTQDPGDA